MLSSLSVKNFAIVDQLHMEWQSGMTTITGETGAGKSIAIDALTLCLGARAESDMVRHGEEKSDVTAAFEIEKNKLVKRWLSDNDLDQNNECILRRVITATGRSRGYINGTPVPLQQMRSLGERLVNVHGQHAHQLLLKPDVQRDLLDGYATHEPLLDSTQLAYQGWRRLKVEYASLQETQSNRDARKQLIEYQVTELDEFAPIENEYQSIDAEHRRLSSGNELLQEAHQSIATLYDDERQTAYQIIQQAASRLAEFASLDKQLQDVSETLYGAAAQVEDAVSDLRRYSEQFEVDPERLEYLEQRLSQYMQLSRKHNVQPDQLWVAHDSLSSELKGLGSEQERLDKLALEIEHCFDSYLQCAQKLHSSREKAALALNRKISKHMHELSMPDGHFTVAVNFDATQAPKSKGLDDVEFLVSTNPGQPAKPLAKVASGGELSRISLAIQVIIAQKVTTPTLIFDEVDVGISGPTAATVGKLLRQLGQATQVICVTHLPQVAATGHQQLFVDKHVVDNKTVTTMANLGEDNRVNEIARLLGGDKITESSKANARELLSKSA